MKNEKINLRGTLHVTDWLSGIRYTPAEEETEIVQVLFKNTRSAFYRNPDRIPLRKGDWVAVEASPGHDIGQVMLTGPLVRLQMKKANVTPDSEIKRIFRKASEADMQKFRDARDREHTTMIRSRQIAADLNLNMKIGDVEFQGDGAKAIFYYIADERVDFRKLIRILADTFKIRIEMKQIGARQEAGRIGGIGPCGRPLCCSSWMSKFVSVGTGAARIQDLSMNPQKLAGQCAKLKCCLNFETDAYAEAAKQMPPKDAVLLTQDAEFYQFKADILARTITYSTDKHIAANLVTIPASRAFEIIALNKQGVKVEQLETEKPKETPQKEYVELVGQDSLTRFDKSGKKKKRRNAKATPAEPRQEKPQKAPERNQEKGAEKSAERPERQRRADRKPDNRKERRPEQRAEQRHENRQEQRQERQERQEQRQHPRRQRENRPNSEPAQKPRDNKRPPRRDNRQTRKPDNAAKKGEE